MARVNSGNAMALFYKDVEGSKFGEKVNVNGGDHSLEIVGFRFTQKMKQEMAKQYGFDRISIVQDWYTDNTYASGRSFASGFYIKEYVLSPNGKFTLVESKTHTNR